MKKVIAVFTLLMATAGFVYASGGQVRFGNPVIDQDGCVLSIPEGIDIEDCQLIPAPDQSGVAVYFCDGIELTATLVCED